MRITAITMIVLLTGPLAARSDAGDVHFKVLFQRMEKAVPAEYIRSGQDPRGPTRGRRVYGRIEKDGKGQSVRSYVTFELSKGPALTEARRAHWPRYARRFKQELLEMGDYAAFRGPPKPTRPAGTTEGQRRPMVIVVIHGQWRIRLELAANRAHYTYDQAKQFIISIARDMFTSLGMTLDGGGRPPSRKKALQLATRIVLSPGENVDPTLDDPDAWQTYIEARFKEHMRNNGNPDAEFPDNYKNVAETFKRVGERFTLPDRRKLNWLALLVQSMHETGFYAFGRRAHGDNFNVAGVGILEEEGRTERQDFGSLPRGVEAFFEHMSVYATGRKIPVTDAHPIAKRTRLTQNHISTKVKAFIARAKQHYPNRGPISLRDMGTAFAGDAPTARKWSGLPNTETDAAVHVERLKQRAKAQFEKYGGTTLGYSGDPLYCGKTMDLWVKATAEVRKIIAEGRDR